VSRGDQIVAAFSRPEAASLEHAACGGAKTLSRPASSAFRLQCLISPPGRSSHTTSEGSGGGHSVGELVGAKFAFTEKSPDGLIGGASAASNCVTDE
jgi:hypothetical protein